MVDAGVASCTLAEAVVDARVASCTLAEAVVDARAAGCSAESRRAGDVVEAEVACTGTSAEARRPTVV